MEAEHGDDIYNKMKEVEIIALILDIFSHKNYDKKFGYK